MSPSSANVWTLQPDNVTTRISVIVKIQIASQLNIFEIDSIINVLQKFDFGSVLFAEIFRVRVDAEKRRSSESMVGGTERDGLFIWGALPHAVTRANVMDFWWRVFESVDVTGDASHFDERIKPFFPFFWFHDKPTGFPQIYLRTIPPK